MRPSLSLTFVAVMATLAYGFSSHHPHLKYTVLSPLSYRSLASISAVPSGGGGGSKNRPEGGTTHVLKETTTARSMTTVGPMETGSKCPVTGLAAIVGSLYGTLGVLYILLKAIARVAPIALEPFQKTAVPLTQVQLGVYIVTCLWFAYVEGYKGFQLKFSPLVVKRSFTLIPGKNGTRWYHYLLAPFYSMGLIHATQKRQITSWSVTIGIALVVAAVKKLPYPYRNIVDAGVVVGLTWGSLSILYLYLQAWISGQPGPKTVDAALPQSTILLKKPE